MELRRAGLVALVEPWANAQGISTIPIPPTELGLDLLSSLEPKFVIFGIGGSSLHAAEPMQWACDVRDMLPGIPCVVLSDRAEPEEAILAARLGHQAFMPTSIEPQIALQAFAFVIGGGTYFPREALLQSVSAAREGAGFSTAIHGDADRLTRRQHEVLDRLRLGKSNKVIARDLDMQESTVKVHVRQISAKTRGIEPHAGSAAGCGIYADDYRATLSRRRGSTAATANLVGHAVSDDVPRDLVARLFLCAGQTGLSPSTQSDTPPPLSSRL